MDVKKERWTMSTKNFEKNALAALLLFTSCALGLVMNGCAQNYSNGERIGVITNLDKKGLMFKSWEGEMLIVLGLNHFGDQYAE